MNGNVLSEQKINLDCEDLNKAKELLKYVDFRELVRVKYHVTVYNNGNMEFAFQDVENLGTLIEYENINDFNDKTIEEINKAKGKMYNEIVETGLKITDEKVYATAEDIFIDEDENVVDYTSDEMNSVEYIANEETVTDEVTLAEAMDIDETTSVDETQYIENEYSNIRTLSAGSFNGSEVDENDNSRNESFSVGA